MKPVKWLVSEIQLSGKDTDRMGRFGPPLLSEFKRPTSNHKSYEIKNGDQRNMDSDNESDPKVPSPTWELKLILTKVQYLIKLFFIAKLEQIKPTTAFTNTLLILRATH